MILCPFLTEILEEKHIFRPNKILETQQENQSRSPDCIKSEYSLIPQSRYETVLKEIAEVD